jgi:small subunit ribosomal protein S1
MHRAVGLIPGHELSWRRAENPVEIVHPGQAIKAEVTGVDWRHERVLLSAKAGEDQALRDLLVSIRPGQILTGTVAEIRDFGVFVNLDGEPVANCTGYSGTGFIRIPELSWSYFDHASDIVEVGQRVTVGALDADTRRGQKRSRSRLPKSTFNADESRCGRSSVVMRRTWAASTARWLDQLRSCRVDP